MPTTECATRTARRPNARADLVANAWLIAASAHARKLAHSGVGANSRGAFAAKALPAGTVISHCAGRRYGPYEIGRRRWEHDLTHVFGLSDGGVIGGAEGGNETQYLNHSCRPNCEAQEIEGDEGLSFIIVALRRIARGAELSHDYALDVGDNDPTAYPCRGCKRKPEFFRRQGVRAHGGS